MILFTIICSVANRYKIFAIFIVSDGADQQQTLTEVMPSRRSTRLRTPNKRYLEDFEEEPPQHLSRKSTPAKTSSATNTPAKTGSSTREGTPSESSRPVQKIAKSHSSYSKRKAEPVTYSPVRPERLLGEGEISNRDQCVKFRPM